MEQPRSDSDYEEGSVTHDKPAIKFFLINCIRFGTNRRLDIQLQIIGQLHIEKLRFADTSDNNASAHMKA